MTSEVHVYMLGAGVQSSTMVQMAAEGALPQPDLAIFSDTGAEPRRVYEHLSFLRSHNLLPFPVEIVSAGSIVDDTYAALRGEKHGKGRAATAPFFVRGRDGRAAPLRRQCTAHYKIEPIEKRLRRLLGAEHGKRLPKGAHAHVYLGISLDEVYRMKPASQSWITRHWPLVDAQMSRSDCALWSERHGYPTAPRSACVFCPYRSDAEWRDLRANDPEGWNLAVEIDRSIRPGFKRVSGEKTTGELYVHRSLMPLDQVDLSTPEDRGQLSMFGEECEGHCGV